MLSDEEIDDAIRNPPRVPLVDFQTIAIELRAARRTLAAVRKAIDDKTIGWKQTAFRIQDILDAKGK